MTEDTAARVEALRDALLDFLPWARSDEEHDEARERLDAIIAAARAEPEPVGLDVERCKSASRPCYFTEGDPSLCYTHPWSERAARPAAPAPSRGEGRPEGWSSEWRDDVTGAGWTRDEAISTAVDLVKRLVALRKAGSAMFPDDAWLLVEGDTIRLNRTAAEAFSVALARDEQYATPAPRPDTAP